MRKRERQICALAVSDECKMIERMRMGEEEEERMRLCVYIHWIS